MDIRAAFGSREARRQGNMLIMAVLFLAFAASAVLTTMSVVNDRTRDVWLSGQELIARQAAQAGVHQAIATVRLTRDMSSFLAPFSGIDAMDSVAAEGAGNYTRIINGRVIADSTGTIIAEVDVFIDVLNRASLDYRDVALSAYAYVPSKAAFNAGQRDAITKDSHCTIRVSLGDSQVFDYAYFINHWGWFYGNTIVANGSVRSNGQFDFGNYSPTLNGSPRYQSANGTDLIGYMDDNSDGITDGSDGGVYSGFQVVNEAHVKGMGGLTKNQHENSPIVPMPNLSDLTWYEARAKQLGASITVNGTTYVNGVLGDEAGEKQHLYLVGTSAQPIVLNGPVVVRGSVILSGYVTGKGTIYSGGNIYVANNLMLKNPPSTWRPAKNDEATTEAWLSANMNKDSLGLFAKEHIVVGDYTNAAWQANVSAWVNHPLNKSKEDAGIDNIQNTKAGPDGILGTADDDVLEDDGKWTVSYYTQADANAGLIPPGKNVGDVIPGSGEDIDGDGKYDGTTQMSEFNIPATLTTASWASNNLTAAAKPFNSIATCNIKELDAALYTNHTLAALMLNWGGDISMNGAIVSRNESIIYGANQIIMNHDERLTGRDGDFFGLFVPRVWNPLSTLQWEFDKSMSIDLSTATTITHYFVAGGGG